MKTETRKLPSLDTRADVTSVDVEKRTFEIMWSAGEKVLRSSYWDGPFFEELSMDATAVRMGRLQSGRAPFLPNHSSYDVGGVLGVIESARLEGGKGYATVRFTPEGIDPEADKIFRKIAAKIIQNVSVGYRTFKTEKLEGVDNKVPTFRAIDWEPYEVSAVAMGADSQAAIRSNAAELYDVEVSTRGVPPITQERMDMTPEEQKKIEEQKTREAEEIAKRQAAEKLAAENAVRAERERISGIRSAVRAAKLEDSVAEKLVTDGVDLDKARAFVLDQLAERADKLDVGTPIGSGIEVGETDREKWVRGVSAAIFEQAGSNCDVARAYARAQKGEIGGAIGREFKAVDLDGGEFRGMRISDIARMVLERAGQRTRGLYGERLIDLALRASTGDFAILLENVTNKSMRASYAVQADTWRRWCGVDSVKDFRAANRYMRGAFSGALPVVAENGEYTNTSIPDGTKISISTEKRGEIITLSREAMINDDMGALVDVAAQFGRKAGQSLEVVAYQQLALNTGLGPDQADTDPFFHDASRANVASSAALSVAAIDADRLKMRSQIFGRDFLDVTPSILLIPVGLESAAKIINESAFDHTVAGGSNKPNPVRGIFRDIVSSPRLTASTTRRYLFEESKSAFKMVFLEGSGEGPTLESREGFRVDGTQWKARIEFKFNSFDPKLAVTNAGT